MGLRGIGNGHEGQPDQRDPRACEGQQAAQQQGRYQRAAQPEYLVVGALQPAVVAAERAVPAGHVVLEARVFKQAIVHGHFLVQRRVEQPDALRAEAGVVVVVQQRAGRAQHEERPGIHAGCQQHAPRRGVRGVQQPNQRVHHTYAQQRQQTGGQGV